MLPAVRRRGGCVIAMVLAAALCASCGSDPQRTGAARVDQPGDCAWTMAGQNLARTHATQCDSADAIGADTLDRLQQVWFFETRAEVTGAPAVKVASQGSSKVLRTGTSVSGGASAG